MRWQDKQSRGQLQEGLNFFFCSIQTWDFLGPSAYDYAFLQFFVQMLNTYAFVAITPEFYPNLMACFQAALVLEQLAGMSTLVICPAILRQSILCSERVERKIVDIAVSLFERIMRTGLKVAIIGRKF
jgi:hypothetical protein